MPDMTCNWCKSKDNLCLCSEAKLPLAGSGTLRLRHRQLGRFDVFRRLF
jgi:hypothetical protein